MAEDRRKYNGGHKTAGRKPKAQELKLIETMDAILAPEEVWKKVAEKVLEGDSHALKLWLEYRLGKPRQQVDVTTLGESVNQPTPLSITVHTPKSDE